jgi:hypothetical protein
MSGPLRRVTIGLLLACIVAACSGPIGPTPTPGGMGDVLPALALRGATVHDVVAGDSGCTQGQLHTNAARIELSVAGDESRYQVYLFRWRRPADFEASAQPFRDCVDEFLADADGEVPLDVVEAAPWRAYGAGWSEEARGLVEEALTSLAGR